MFPPVRQIAFRLPAPYIFDVGQPAMAINVLRNKRCGPGGGTRRLHLLFQAGPSGPDGLQGGESGSTRVVKAWLLLGMVPPLSGHSRSANDNRMALAA